MLPTRAANLASAIMSLSKRAWRLGTTLSKLDRLPSTMIPRKVALQNGVKALGNECDLIFTELDSITSRAESSSQVLHSFGERFWDCLDALSQETSMLMHELENFVERVGVEEHGSNPVHGQNMSNRTWDRIEIVQTKLDKQTDFLRLVVLSINFMAAYSLTHRLDDHLQDQLNKLQFMAEKLKTSATSDSNSRFSNAEAGLIQWVHETTAQAQAASKARASHGSPRPGQEQGNIPVGEWLRVMESMRQEIHISGMNEGVKNTAKANTPTQHATTSGDTAFEREGSFEDDLEMDVIKAALGTGADAFEMQEWNEADSLLLEALQLLHQLSREKCVQFDIFTLHYRLAVCAYHIREPHDAESALSSFLKLPVASSEQRTCIYHARHLLSLLYIRIDQFERARYECDLALQGRRRLLGKEHKTSLESTALMARILVLLNNSIRAKFFLAMIPETQRDAIVKDVDDSIRTATQHYNIPPTRPQSVAESTTIASVHAGSRLSGSTLGLALEEGSYHPLTQILDTPVQSSPPPPPPPPPQRTLSNHTAVSLSAGSTISDTRSTHYQRQDLSYDHTAGLATETASPGLSEPFEPTGCVLMQSLSRKEILDRIGCHPRDNIEEAVCEGDYSALGKLLDKKKDFWRSKLRKRVRPERLTALHFAALFGEVPMARSLLHANFNINEIPYGYTTRLSPLKVAIGARQVAMVEYLITHGARPSPPDTWSTLAAQLLSRSWLMKTLSDSDKDLVPDQVIGILNILLRYGWNINEICDSSETTLLHQSVTFWTGSYRWDLKVRVAVTSFLCEKGADPFQANIEGKTPFNLAVEADDRDVVMVLDQHNRRKEVGQNFQMPVELSS